MNDDDGAYGSMHLREDYRYQAFQARAQHRVHTNPTTRMDWYEIMQHHFMGTRLMDWSESAYIGLSFALDPYMDPAENSDTKYRRQVIDPTVWVIDPTRLNERAFAVLMKSSYSKSLIENALEKSIDPIKFFDKFDKLEEEYRKELFFLPTKDKRSLSLSGIVSISTIEAMRRDAGSRLNDMLSSLEFNPFFYLIARYYCDGVPADLDVGLPPLATMHPYHSDRIEAQHGAFTCFPYYRLNSEEKLCKEYLTDPRAMEEQIDLVDCLYEIDIINPARVARELLESGMRISHVYPELDRFARDLEATDFHV